MYHGYGNYTCLGVIVFNHCPISSLGIRVIDTLVVPLSFEPVWFRNSLQSRSLSAEILMIPTSKHESQVIFRERKKSGVTGEFYVDVKKRSKSFLLSISQTS